MSNFHTNIPKEQQTAYQRWEMSSFGHSENGVSQARKKEADAASATISAALESVRKEAYAKGMQEGFAVGMAKAGEVLQDDRQRLVALATSFTQSLEMADEKVEEDILALALDIAKAMVKTRLHINPLAILPVVRDAMHYLPEVQHPARIVLHPDDAHVVREHLAEELAEQKWLIQEEESIERGGCLVETGTNQIDATNAVRWKRISEALVQSNEWLDE